MTKTTSALMIAVFLIISSSMAVIVSNSDSNSDVDGVIDYSTDDWIEISTPLQLSQIGTAEEYPLDGKYVLTDDIDFTDGDVNLNGGFDFYLKITADGTNVKVAIHYSADDEKVTSAAGISVSLNGAVLTTTTGETGNFLVTDIDASMNIIVGGLANNVPGHEGNMSLAGAATLEFDDGSSVVSGAIDSNGNMDPISGTFAGTFHGDGHKIIGLRTAVFGMDTVYSALFAQAAGAIFDGLGLEDGSSISIVGAPSADSYAGSFVASASASMVTITPRVTMSVTMTDCYNTGSVSAWISTQTSSTLETSFAGGLVGQGSSEMTDCYNTGPVSASSISRTYARAYVGGVLGHGTSIITNCYNTGPVSASTTASSMYTGSSVGRFTAYSIAGGILGHGNSTVNLRNSYNTAPVSASSTISTHETPPSNSYIVSNVGGLVGSSDTVDIGSSYNTGPVSASAWIQASTSSSVASYTGGLVGQGGPVIVTNSYNTGDITAKGKNQSHTGGIFGYCDSAMNLTNSYNTGDITVTGSNEKTGGILGDTAGGSFSSYTILTNCYFYSSSNIKLASNTSSIIIDGLDRDTRATLPSGRIPLEDMKSEDSYFKDVTVVKGTNVAGWDFTDIWGIDDTGAINNGLPYLLPKITKQPADVTANDPVGNEFSVEVSFIPEGLQWKKFVSGSWVDIPGATRPTYVTTSEDVFGDQFKCKVIHWPGMTATSDIARLLGVNLDVTVTGDGKLSYAEGDITGTKTIENIATASIEFTVIPDEGNRLLRMMLDSEDITSSVIDGKFTVDTTSSHTLTAEFELVTSYNITATAGPGGSISPEGTVTVEPDEEPEFTFTPDAGYGIKDVKVGSTTVEITGNKYKFSPVNSDQTISVSFMKTELKITVGVGDGGSMTPGTDQTVQRGSTPTFTVMPDDGYTVRVEVDGSPVTLTDGVYTFQSVQDDHTIEAVFEIMMFDVNASVDGTNGTVGPATQNVSWGGDATITITPDYGYTISEIVLDGVPVTAITNPFVIGNVTDDHDVVVKFIAGYTVSASVDGTGGSISPSGEVPVTSGGNLTFTTAADTNYRVSEVKIDGVPTEIAEDGKYYFVGVGSDHSIVVTFEIITYTITASTGENGSISPPGQVSVDVGTDRTFTVTANDGYKVSTVKVDGNDATLTDGKYTFTNVTGNHTIEVTFVVNESPGSNDNTMLFVAIGVIAAVAVLGVVYFVFIRKP